VKETIMSKLSFRSLLAAVAVSTVGISLAGCAVSPSQSVGAYVDDTVLTTKVKSKFVEAETVDAASISVETINGTVLLRGKAKDSREKSQAEQIARSVDGVKAVNNRIDVSS
jgi:hyperosmotically inducible periplasmic protein